MSPNLLLTLLIVHDVSVAVTSNAGAAVVVQAYARPPSSYFSRSPNNSQCIFLDRKQPNKLACELRCGGTKNDHTSPSRHATSILMTQSRTGTEVKNNGKYHLIWSPNFWKKMTLNMTLWLIIQYTLKKNTAGLEKLFAHDLHACHGQPNAFQRIFPTAVLLPLLSSSCCAIQLVINALSGWGCAGFNTYLGPIRPILLPILLFSTWKLLPNRSLGWTIISLFLAFLPELVDIWNTTRPQKWQQRHVDNGNNNMEFASTSSPLPVTAKLRLGIPTMGCVACVNKVDASIRQCKSATNIREETSWLTDADGSAKGGMAELSIMARTNEEVDRIAEEVVAAVKNAGFQCNVESLRVDKI